VFGTDGVKRTCEELDINFLGDIPLHAKICRDADEGKPTIVAEPESTRAKTFRDIADEVAVVIGL
jgi:ATP-binding protein involved in chromosome partitioning